MPPPATRILLFSPRFAALKRRGPQLYSSWVNIRGFQALPQVRRAIAEARPQPYRQRATYRNWFYRAIVLASLGARGPLQGKIARTVGALFIDSDGKVLLGLRSPSKKAWPLHWDSIGGHVEDGESLDDALVREAREEVGVTPSEFRLIATVRERRPEIYGDALHHIYAVTRWQGGDPANVCDEHTELKWFSISEMLLLSNIVDADYPRFAQRAMTDNAN
jgi:8-oxo-dGTP diphosphatase